MVKEASRIKKICRNKAIFIINDRVDVALAVDADGIHIGQTDLPLQIARTLLGRKKIIGVTVHNQAEARLAAKQGADYLAISPIFKTTTKCDAGKACGPKMIQIINQYGLPTVAIGGITKSNCPEVLKAGADFVVGISSVLAKGSVYEEVIAFNNIIRGQYDTTTKS
jgi:thiamine-phosphate pyrophosphorylase